MTPRPPALQVSCLSKRFGSLQALDSVSLEVFAGEVHAVAGENGAGKSTLINLLVGALQPDRGTITVGGREMKFRNARDAARAGIAAVFQELSLVPSLTIAENLFANRLPANRAGFIRRAELFRRAENLLRSFDVRIPADALVAELSAAQHQVIEILKCLAANPCVLLLDEPTSSLTQREKEILFDLIRRLREQKHGLIYISHHLSEVLELADRVTVLRDGKRVDTRPRGGIREADLIRLMVGRELQDIYGRPRDLNRAGAPRLRVETLSRGEDFKEVTFDAWPGEIVGIAGLVGAGRTELARALFGAEPPSCGTIRLDNEVVTPRSPGEAIRLGIAYVSEDRKTQGLFLRHAIRDNIVAPRFRAFSSRWGLLSDRAIDEAAESARRRTNIVAPDTRQRVGRLSGGNQQKVLLAMWIGVEPRVLIVDEPTRGVDVGARSEIYAQLRELAVRGAAIVLISSDLQEILGMSDRLLVMRLGRMVAEFSRHEAAEQRIIAAALGASQDELPIA